MPKISATKKCLLVIVLLLGFGSLLMHFLHRPKWEVIDTQPKTMIRLLPDSKNGDEIPKAITAATAFFNPGDDYWPIASEIREGEKEWWVYFSRKQLGIRFKDNREYRMMSDPSVECILVEKQTLVCSAAGSM